MYVPAPCPYSTVDADRRQFRSNVNGLVQTCGEGLEFDDSDELCTCIIVSASMLFYTSVHSSIHRFSVNPQKPKQFEEVLFISYTCVWSAQSHDVSNVVK